MRNGAARIEPTDQGGRESNYEDRGRASGDMTIRRTAKDGCKGDSREALEGWRVSQGEKAEVKKKLGVHKHAEDDLQADGEVDRSSDSGRITTQGTIN